MLASAAGPWLAKPLVAASPFLASSVPWSASPSWAFDPKVSNLLYRVWVGTDFAVVYPSWITCVAGHVLVGCALFAATELPRIIGERRADATGPSDPPKP